MTIPTTPISKVPGWYAVGTKIKPASILSKEAFGTLMFAYSQPLFPVSITSKEAFGTLTTTKGPVNLLPTGIVSAQAFGTLTIITGPVSVAPTGIASGEAFGTTTVGRGTVNISLTGEGIASRENINDPRIMLYLIVSTGIASAEAVGALSVTRGPVGITVGGIPSEEAFGPVTVTPGPINLLVSGIASAEAFGTTTVSLPAFTGFIEENVPRTSQPVPTATQWTGVWVTLIGAGGSGASGRRNSGGFETTYGGGGGAGAGFIPRTFIPKVNLGSTYNVTIPVATNGGAQVTTTNANGNNGEAGGAALFSSGATSLSAGGGGLGVGGRSSAGGTGGVSGAVSGAFGDAGTNGGDTGAAGINNDASNAGGAGGGGGMWINNAGSGQVSGKGGNTNGQNGGAAGVSTAGGNGSALVAGVAGSGAGGGGIPNVGGTAPGYGGGGGGGAAGNPTYIASAGGGGGPGYSKIEFVVATPPLVTFADVGVGNPGVNAATASWQHTINGNALIVAFNLEYNTGGGVPTAKVGGVSMTQLAANEAYYNQGGYYAAVYLYGILNPPTGLRTIQIGYPSGNMFLCGNSMSYNNVTGFGPAQTVTAATRLMTQNTQSGFNQMVVQAFSGWSATMGASNQSQRYYAPPASANMSFICADSATQNPTFTSNQGAAGAHGGVAVALLN